VVSNLKRQCSIVIAGGGTGGHVTPALAIAAATRADLQNNTDVTHSETRIDVHFIGTINGIERTMVPNAGWPIDLLPAKKIKGQSKLRRLIAITSLLPNTWRAWRILCKKKATVVIGVGGYASVPAVLAAVLRRTPVIIIEANAIPGLANRYLSKFAKAVITNYDLNSADHDGKHYFNPTKVHQLGNPVRQKILTAFTAEGTTHDSQSEKHSSKTLLVLGGSQGARAINNMIKDAANDLLHAIPNLHIIHQCGRANFDELNAHYKATQLDVDLRAFIDDMPAVYKVADLVISRAGATTLSELAIAGKAAIFIPLPSATDNHQWHNAERYAAKDAAVLLNQKDLSPAKLAETVHTWLTDDGKRSALAHNIRTLSKPHAATQIVNLALQIC